MDFINENFNLSVNIPLESALLHIYFEGEVMKGELILRTFVEIS
jgi:hypothetical protein